MSTAITIIQIVLSISLSALILIQSKGAGIGRAWGGGGGGGTSFTRRGLEKILFRLTFVLAALFIGVSVIQLVI